MANNKAFKVKNGLELAEYAKDITGTAVDVYVYDTSLDSDSGAWRQRTQATSWYNETLNTATRGNRKEFPAVAVIIAVGNTIEIYDGDDPALPMWMIWPNSGMCGGTVPISSLHALNGVLSTGGNTAGDGFRRISYIDETFFQIRASDSLNRSAPFSQRSTYTGIPIDNTTYGQIVNDYVNDVAMTVLPNAPVDPATGLPVPTILVGTDGGWSQISDDGNVYDFTFTNNPKVTSIAFKNDTTVQWNGASTSFNFDRGYFEIPLIS